MLQSSYTPQEQPVATATARRRLTIGLPSCTSDNDRRFPLTPEGVKALVDKGHVVKIQAGAAATIHYADAAYSRCGAEITDRGAALACDIVVNTAPLDVIDIHRMRRGAMLLTLLHLDLLTPEIVRAMQEMSIVGVAIDLIGDNRGNHPFADILAEIDGRAAIATAASILADAEHGKGILLGGVAGLNPCEVMIIGSGIAATAAARSASGLGAVVRMFDNDVYSLRAAARELGPQVIGSSFHERVIQNALRTADVIIATTDISVPPISGDVVDMMKRGVVIIDLNANPGTVFPSLPRINLTMQAEPVAYSGADSPGATRRVCYVNAGSVVPRTAAMALSNTFNTLLDTIVSSEGLNNALKLTAGLRMGVFTFLGKITNPDVAEIVGARYTDLNIFLQLS